jgi:hypothetical protein
VYVRLLPVSNLGPSSREGRSRRSCAISKSLMTLSQERPARSWSRAQLSPAPFPRCHEPTRNLTGDDKRSWGYLIEPSASSSVAPKRAPKETYDS